MIKSLFTKFPWTRDREGIFRFSSQDAHMSTTHGEDFSLSLLLLNVKQESCKYHFFIVFGVTRPGIEPDSTVSVADALSIRPLMGFILNFSLSMVEWIECLFLWLGSSILVQFFYLMFSIRVVWKPPP